MKLNQDDLIKEVSRFYVHYCDLNSAMELYNQLEKLKIYQIKGNISPKFFETVYLALVDSFMLSFARLYEKDEKINKKTNEKINKNINTISKLIKQCIENVDYFHDGRDDAIRKLKGLEAELNNSYFANIITRIKNNRNKIFAHNDRKWFFDIQQQGGEVCIGELNALLLLTGKIMKYCMEQLSVNEKPNDIYNNDLCLLLYSNVVVLSNAGNQIQIYRYISKRNLKKIIFTNMAMEECANYANVVSLQASDAIKKYKYNAAFIIMNDESAQEWMEQLKQEGVSEACIVKLDPSLCEV